MTMKTGKLLRITMGVSLAMLCTGAGSGAKRQGYLPAGSFDLLQVLPPAPVVGDARATADRAIFRRTRAMIGSPRWALATRDVKTDTASMMADFSCAVGVNLTPANAPHLAALVQRAGADTSFQTNAAKNFYKRERPFHYDKGQVCQPTSELADSFDYPSGHATWGWTWASILAELVPDHSTAILARGRTFAESRIVCGAHNASAAEEALVSAGATLTAVHTVPAFRSDMAAAKSELELLRKSGPAPDAVACAATEALGRENIYR